MLADRKTSRRLASGWSHGRRIHSLQSSVKVCARRWRCFLPVLYQPKSISLYLLWCTYYSTLCMRSRPAPRHALTRTSPSTLCTRSWPAPCLANHLASPSMRNEHHVVQTNRNALGQKKPTHTHTGRERTEAPRAATRRVYIFVLSVICVRIELSIKCLSM